MILPQSGPREGAGEIPMMTNTMVAVVYLVIRGVVDKYDDLISSNYT